MYFFQVIVYYCQEVVVGGKDVFVYVKFDYCLGFVDCCQLVGEIGCLEFLCGDVGGKFYYFVGLVIVVEYGVVGCLDLYFLVVFVDLVILVGVEFVVFQFGLECVVFFVLCLYWVDEYCVVLFLDFCQGVVQCLQEVVVGFQDGVVKVEFDYGLYVVQGCDLCFQCCLVVCGCFGFCFVVVVVGVEQVVQGVLG